MPRSWLWLADDTGTDCWHAVCTEVDHTVQPYASFAFLRLYGFLTPFPPTRSKPQLGPSDRGGRTLERYHSMPHGSIHRTGVEGGHMRRFGGCRDLVGGPRAQSVSFSMDL
jgi:hypothetical protein